MITTLLHPPRFHVTAPVFVPGVPSPLKFIISVIMGLKSQFFLLVAVGLFMANASELVPVYMWQTIPTKGVFPAVTHVSKATFREVLLQKQTHQHSDRMIIFAETNLSPEDFSAMTFYELRQLADHSRVTYLPTVSSPMDVIQDLNTDIVVASVDDIISDPSLLKKKQLIIDLNDAKDDEDRVDMLKRHSKFIAEVYEKVSASNSEKVLCIYTGHHSSWIVPSEIVKHRLTRALKDDDHLTILPNYFVYIHGSFFKIDKNDSNKLTKFEKDGSVTQGENILTIPTTAGDIVLHIRTDSMHYWIVDTVDFGGKSYQSDIHAPFGFSYSCSSNLTLREIATKEHEEDFKPYFLQFPHFQVQYFDNGTAKIESFDDSYDCVGFTSPAIWSGLFVTFILAMIMAMGLAMIMDIKTMDRFDDPKGKTITVNATE